MACCNAATMGADAGSAPSAGRTVRKVTRPVIRSRAMWRVARIV
jgi:hypothetical protein